MKRKGPLVRLTPAQKLQRIDELLEVTYRSTDLGNLEDPLDETIYILLSRQTRQGCYQRLFSELRCRYPRWMDVLHAAPADLERILRPGGFQRARTRELVGILEAVRADNEVRKVGPYAVQPKDLTLDYLRSMSDTEAEKALDALPGIGPKSARCIQSYSLGRERFAVDTHVYRIVARLGILKTRNRKTDHDPLERAVEPAIRKRLHMNLVHHGRAICTSQKPKCDQCVLISFCRTGRTMGRRDHKPLAIELFAGAGGFGTGCQQEGFRIALAVELDRNAAQTYRANHPGVVVAEADVRRLRASDIRRLVPGVGEPSVLLAGPPCQGYSRAGARKANDPKNLLFRHVSRLARELNAAYVVIENVPGFQNVQGFSFLHRLRVSLGRSRYAAKAYLLDAADFGVAQVRKRFICLGRRRDIKDAPPPAPLVPDAQPVEGRLMRALAGLPSLAAGMRAEYARLDDGTLLLNASTMNHSAAVVRKISAVRKPGQGPISYRRLGTDLAPTLIAGHRALPVHPVLNRTISVREAARIQGFTDTYVFCGPRSTQPLQVANAVPPALARAIAAHVRRMMEEDRLIRRRTTGNQKLLSRSILMPSAISDRRDAIVAAEK